MGLNNMTDINPHESDAVLGGNSTPLIDAAILGGELGRKHHRLSDNSMMFNSIYEQYNDPKMDHCIFETFTINNYGEIISSTKKRAQYYTENLGNNVTLDMVYIPAGSLMMGSNERDCEQPIHQVTLKSFYMAKYPTTQAQYLAVMGHNPSPFQGDGRHPVDQVTRDQALTFCRLLSGSTGREYSLPSESEWEYACRASTTTPFSCGDIITADFANYNRSYCEYGMGRTSPVGKYPPNPWGLYDMHGNIWELCYDRLPQSAQQHSYKGAPEDGNPWLQDDCHGVNVYRGGCWFAGSQSCRSSTRLFFSPQSCRSSTHIIRNDSHFPRGFRLVSYWNRSREILLED
jgi:formylglycine-generating enzyme required for sulfatase activity